MVNPEAEAALAKIYTQTLARTYVNAAGERILLSVAYGDDQRGEATQAHRPEMCYTAQGLAITSNDEGTVWTFQLDPELMWCDGNPVTANFALRTFELDQPKTDAIVAALANVLPK